MELSAQAILDGLICGRPGCQCRASARNGRGLTHCPAHDDRHPSLSVSERDGKVLIKCHAGCGQPEVIDALKADWLWGERRSRPHGRSTQPQRDSPERSPEGTLHSGHPERSDTAGDAQSRDQSSHRKPSPSRGTADPSTSGRRGRASGPSARDDGQRGEHHRDDATRRTPGENRPSPLTRYPIRDLAGRVVAMHVRRDDAQGKHLSWELPDGLPGLAGIRAADLPLYGVHELGDRLAIILVEGEKARDALAGIGLPAVGTVTGAASLPADVALAPLAGRKVYLWPDADPPGLSHMRRIAERLAALGCDVIKRVHWKGAPVGGDAADFIAQGGSQEDIVHLLSTAAIWTDDDDEPDPGDDGAGVRPVMTRLAEVTPETVRWLWPGRLPQGKLTILDGDPGLGKSTVLLDLAARLTTAAPMPDGSRAELDGPAGVILLSAEDGLADTVQPRLTAAGADLNRVSTLHLADQHGEQLLDLSRDLDHLGAAIGQEQAALVIIDPLVAYLGSRVDAYRDQDIRRVLAPLARLAETTNAAIIGVRHLTKGGGTNAKYRGGGSIGIIGAARSGLLVAADPEDAERRILATIKSNLAAPVPALAYRLEPASEQGVRIAWEGVTSHTAAQLLAEPREAEEPSAVDEAVEVLTIILADGPVPAKEVQRQAREAGVSERTLMRAKAKLAIVATKTGFHPAVWKWELPKDANALIT